MKKITLVFLFSLCLSMAFAKDILPSNNPIKGVLHKDTTTHSFRLMVNPIQINEVEYTLCTRELDPTTNNLSDIYSFRFYHINKEDIKLKISFCSTNDLGKEEWSIPTEVNVKTSTGSYQENSLTNLSSNININLSKVSKIKISTSKAALLDEFEFYYFQKEKIEFKPNMREMKKKLRAEKQKQKDKKSKEYNKIREAEYKDHF